MLAHGARLKIITDTAKPIGARGAKPADLGIPTARDVPDISK